MSKQNIYQSTGSSDDDVRAIATSIYEENRKPVSNTRMKAIVIAGGILIELSLGTVYTFGNMTPYMTSYLKVNGISDITYAGSTWIFACAALGQGLSLFIGGALERKVGPRICTIIGGWSMALGVLLTYVTVQHSFGATLVTYGLMFGLGVGVAYAIPMAVAMRWMPERKGLVNGLVVAGFGGGAFIFDYIQTGYINPGNGKPEKNYPPDITDKYFDQKDILDRVPVMFLILGGCYACMQLLGSIAMINPPGYRSAKERTISVTDESENTHINSNDQSPLYGDISSKNGNMPNHVSDEFSLEADTSGLVLSPKQMLKEKSFYILWMIFLVNGIVVIFISSLYKAYGQVFIHDDIFLAIVGAFASVCNGGGRIMWGYFGDRFSFRLSMMALCTMFAALIFTFSITPYGGKPVFFIWTCLLFLTFSGNFSLFPTVTARAFGQEYYPLNYGCLFTSQVVSSPLGAILTSSLKSILGWNGMFFLCGGLSVIGAIITYFFNVKRADGRDI